MGLTDDLVGSALNAAEDRLQGEEKEETFVRRPLSRCEFYDFCELKTFGHASFYADEKSFVEIGADILTKDPLKFEGYLNQNEIKTTDTVMDTLEAIYNGTIRIK